MDIPLQIMLVRTSARSQKPKTIHIPVPTSAQGFKISRRGNLHLVVPDKRPVWTSDTRYFRSLVFDKAGRVVSAGLPKFMSPGRNINLWQRTLDAAELGERPRIYEKLDGSLIIRSVDRGRVIWRTRGSLDLGSFGVRIEPWVRTHAPQLMDANFEPDVSLQMEWCDLQTRVVVAHPQPRLVLLAGCDNAGLEELTRSCLQVIADRCGLAIVREFDYDGHIERLPSWVNERFGPGAVDGPAEGIVCVFEDRQGRATERLRIKTDWYMIQHALRFSYNPSAVLRAWDRVNSGNPKGKAKRRKQEQPAVDRVLDRLGLAGQAGPAADQVRRICAEIERIDSAVEAEWEMLLGHAKRAGEDTRLAARLGLDPVASSVFANLAKKRGKAKSQLIVARRAEGLAHLAR